MNIFGPLLVAHFASVPSIHNVRLIKGPEAVFQQVEFRIDLLATYQNPFDAREVALDLRAIAPSGRIEIVPGFLYKPFRRDLGKGSLAIAYASDAALKRGSQLSKRFDRGELLTPTGSEEWRVRFTPTEAGRYQLAFILRDRNGVAHPRPAGMMVRRNPTGRGFAAIDPTNSRAFRLTSGQGLFPIGANLGWAGERGTRDFDDWLAGYGKTGANWARVWLSPSWTTFGLEQPNMPGRIDLANAWRLDYVLDAAARHGIYLDLCIDSYNVLREGTNWPEWVRSPFNRANEGPLAKPADFWSNPEVAARYENKLRYLVARWGGNPYVFCWEFWNEVDGITDFRADKVKAWCQRMGRFLKSVDPYHHLVTSSYGGNGAGAGDADVFGLKEIDYAVSHVYDAPDGPSAVVEAQRRLTRLNKPHFVAEFGADSSSPRAEEDPHGLQLHDALWASLACGASGGSMLWWWDSYIHPKNLYPLIGVATSFLNGIDWGREKLMESSVRIEFSHQPRVQQRRDLVFEGATTSWSPSPYNRPESIRIDTHGFRGGPVAGLLQGIRNHPNLHNPITFETNLPWATRFEAVVGDVSGYGGAALRISIDGKPVFDSAFSEPPGSSERETLKQYSATHSFLIEPGQHRIVVENDGPDWVRVDYRFKNVVLQTGPPLDAWASVGPNFGVVWVRHKDRTWRNVIERKMEIPPSPPARLLLPGLQFGHWKAALWNTWNGRILSLQPFVVTAKTPASIDLPAISTDLAVRLDRVSGKRH